MAYTAEQIENYLVDTGLLNDNLQITKLFYTVLYYSTSTNTEKAILDDLIEINNLGYIWDQNNVITQTMVDENPVVAEMVLNKKVVNGDLTKVLSLEGSSLVELDASSFGIYPHSFKWTVGNNRYTLGGNTRPDHFDATASFSTYINTYEDIFTPSTQDWDYFVNESDYLVDTENYISSPVPLTVEEFETLSQALVNEINTFGSELGTSTKEYVDGVIADLVLEHTNDFNILNTAISNINGKITNINNDLDGLRLALQNEILRAQNAETLNLDEIARIEAKEDQNKIDLENALSSLSSAIANEVTQLGSDKAAIEAEINYILGNVDGSQLDSLVKIKTAFENADSDILTALNNLAAERTLILNAYIEQYNTKITEIETNISQNAMDLATEISRATNKEAEIIASIIANTNARVEAEGLIELDIQELTTQINNVDTFGYEEIERLENLEGQNKANQIALNAVYEAKINSLYTSLKNLVSNDLLQVFNNKFI